MEKMFSLIDSNCRVYIYRLPFEEKTNLLKTCRVLWVEFHEIA